MLTRRDFFEQALYGAMVGPLLISGNREPVAAEPAAPAACDHDLRLYDFEGRLLGSWEIARDKYGEKVCCGLCGRFYSYLHPDVPDACWYYPWDELADADKTSVLALVGEKRLGNALSVEQASKLSAYFMTEYFPAAT